MFTWIPIHREAIHRILEYRRSQTELLAILREMELQGLKVISLQDQGADGQAIPLAEIDPFTFLASFNRGVTEKSRRDNWIFLKARWSLKAPVPDDFNGIPTLNNMRSWLFPYAKEREKDHVERLWHVASLAVDGSVEQASQEAFDRCLTLKFVGFASLTIGMFWINPEKFLPADHKTTAYGRKAKGVATEPKSYESYQIWMREMTERAGGNYPQVSHEAHLFATQNQSKLDLTPERMEVLWARFHKVIKGFTDFQNPGDNFVDEETGYKRAILKKFQQELGAEKLSALVAQGQGIKAAKEIIRVLTSNLVNFHAWNATLGETDQAACDVVRECLKATSAPYQGPESTSDLFDACARHNLKPSWDALTVLLWALRPQDFFPVKISFYHKLSTDLGHELPSGRPDADKLHSLIEFGRAFWKALEPQKPSDWVDVQSFIWCVCPGNYPGRLAKPFDTLFTSWADANSAFNLLRWTLGTLEVTEDGYERDTRIALTLPTPQTPPKMRLNFGNWAILTFFGPEQGKRRLQFLCRKDIVPASADSEGQFADLIDDQAFTLAFVGPNTMYSDGSSERTAFETTLTQASKRFAKWEGSPYRSAHRPELLRMVFDSAERERLLLEGLGPVPPVVGPVPLPGAVKTNIAPTTKIEPYDKKTAMAGLFLAESQFDEMLAALREKKNVVLQGAPGVGKTYVARRLAYALIESNDPQRIEIIQFHQSYSYEDFIQGFRPTPKGHFDLKYGIFHQFCRRAQREEAQGRPYVFIIDEINRGNLSKIFGELMMLIEPDKRGKEHAIPLAYSQDADEKFYIPENVHLIGMMNTADRSLAMVDYALRRRFRFITLRPEFSSEAFRDFLADAGAKPELVKKIVARMNALNEVIAADTKNLGPGYQIGHSYFCPRNGIKPDDDWYRRVIESEIVPLIQEYWFDNEQKVKEQRSALLA